MIKIVRTDSENNDFIKLVKDLDAYLVITDQEDHDFYNQFNKLDTIKYVVLIYFNGKPVGCGAIKKYDAKTMEVKRMFTSKENRGKGFASRILTELEQWAKEMLFTRCILETGIRQPEAINLYKKNSYTVIENYGQYTNVHESVCFEKKM